LSAGKNSLEGLLDGGVLFDFHFLVEGNDRPKGAFFGQDSKLSLRKVLWRHSLDICLLLVELIEVFLTELEKGKFWYQDPERFSIVENFIGLLVLLSDVEMKLNYGYDDIVEYESDDFCEDFLASEYYLGFVLGVELEVKPGDFEHVHSVQVVFHSQIFISFHLNEVFHHQFQWLKILLSDDFFRYNFFKQSLQ
jgi:hypothetical protein